MAAVYTPIVAEDPDELSQPVLSLWKGKIVPMKLHRPAYPAALAAIMTSYQVTEADLIGRGRTRHIVAARQHLMALLQQAEWSTTQIGRKLGGRDHTTIVFGIKAHRRRSAI